MADYTDNYTLAQPEDGAYNAGDAINGNMDIIDAELFNARNILTYEGDVLTYEGDVLYYANP
jgi:hypothetical protein